MLARTCSGSNIATTGYDSGALGVLTLTGAISQILNVSNDAGVQLANLGSGDISSTTLPNLAKGIIQAFDSDPTVSGIGTLKIRRRMFTGVMCGSTCLHERFSTLSVRRQI